MRIVLIVIVLAGCPMLDDMGRVACYYAKAFVECKGGG